MVCDKMTRLNCAFNISHDLSTGLNDFMASGSMNLSPAHQMNQMNPGIGKIIEVTFIQRNILHLFFSPFQLWDCHFAEPSNNIHSLVRACISNNSSQHSDPFNSSWTSKLLSWLELQIVIHENFHSYRLQFHQGQQNFINAGGLQQLYSQQQQAMCKCY